MKQRACSRILQHALFAALIASSTLALAAQRNTPPRNLYLADSPSNIAHADAGQSDYSAIPGPVDRTRRLAENEIIFKPIGFANGWDIMYSGPYPDGRRAIWSGGRDRVVKLDADTLDVISTLALPGYFYTESEVKQFFDKLDRMIAEAGHDPKKYPAVYDHAYSQLVPAVRQGAGAIYKLLSSDNEFFFTSRNPEGGITLQKYGDADPKDIRSPVVLKGKIDLPTPKGLPVVPMAMNMTYDGWVVCVTNSGTVFVVSRDLTQYQTLQLPEAQSASQSAEWMGGLVRNSVSVDDEGGIYVVSRAKLHRVQWNGKQLSLDPKDGAWSVEYPSGENGSGTTAVPVGWGDGADKLVVIMDGANGVKIYWRDKIPDDWKGIEGQPRRLAGMQPIDFGKATPAKFTVEASPSTYGYGFFWQNDTPKNPPPNPGAFDKRIMLNFTALAFPEHEVSGGVKFEWNPKTRTLDKAWLTDLSLAVTSATVNANGLLYGVGRRDGEFSFEALDWKTGKPVFHYLLGKSFIFNPTGFTTRIAPNGAVDLSSMGAAILRLTPKINAHDRQRHARR